MPDAIKEIPVGKFTIKIFPDEIVESPREDGCLTTMICFHNRYNLGDKHDMRSQDYNGWNGVYSRIVEYFNPVIIQPIYLYDHSGITISTSDTIFSAMDSHGWDWGIVGFVFISREKFLKEYNQKEFSEEFVADKMEEITKVLNSEISVYDMFLRGDFYGYVIENEEGEEVNSCWGFYGMDDVESQAKEAAEVKESLKE